MTKIEQAKEMQKRIHEALINEWDPIGVKDFPEAQDTYDMYIPTIYKFLITDNTKQELLDFLWWLETEHMGLKGDFQWTQKFAEDLLQLKSDKKYK